MEEQPQPEDQNLEHNTDEAVELQKLEEDVKLMAHKISDFRQNLPDQLKDALASIISAQIPPNMTRLVDDSVPGPSGNPNQDARTPLDSEGRVKLSVEKDPEHAGKVQKIEQKISDNASAIPLLVKRMEDCISRIDKLDSFKPDMIHPAFTRKWRR